MIKDMKNTSSTSVPSVRTCCVLSKHVRCETGGGGLLWVLEDDGAGTRGDLSNTRTDLGLAVDNELAGAALALLAAVVGLEARLLDRWERGEEE